MTRSVSRLALAAMLLSLASSAGADGPILHEYIEPDPSEDVRFSATTPDGTMPAALDTPSGVVSAPSASRPKDPRQLAYGGSSTPDSIDASYRIDRDTTRPDLVSYDDPFIPAIAPFKRLYAYDSIDESFELGVFDKKLRPIEIGGETRLGEDQFYADLFVDVGGGIPVRIPSVGPGARVLVARVEPQIKFELVRDGADNWFLVADGRKRVRLVMQLAIARASFGSPFGDVAWSELVRYLPPLPPALRTPAGDVLASIGVSQNNTPRSAVASLVAYYRGFAPSEELPRSTSGPALYQELSLSRKGVCRHRAYAFVISALALGVPARMVRNEAHAWVEVFDGTLWHRIDLGGAAGQLEYEQNSPSHLHRPPDDPYRWPEGSQSAAAMAEQAFQASGAPGATGQAAPSPSADPRGDRRDPSTQSGPDANADPVSNAEGRPRAVVSMDPSVRDARRGAPLHVTGSVRADGDACPFARVDLSLRDRSGEETWLGALPTDASGRYDGRVTIPLSIDVGDYSLVASTPGAGRCAGSQK